MCYELETLNLSHIKSKLRKTKVEGPWFFRMRYFEFLQIYKLIVNHII